jgi:hypothetical protein
MSPGAEYMAALDGNTQVLAQIGRAFAPHQNSPAAMNIQVDAGSLINTATGAVVSQAVQTSGTITAPSSHPRIDLAVVNAITGVLSVVTGTEASSPVAPACPVGSIPLAQIALAVGQTSIVNTNLTDVRTFLAVPPPFARTRQVFGSGNGTYTAPAGVKYIVVRMIGGGGGGAGSGSAGAGNGGTGGNTTFGTTLLAANGGSGANSGGPGHGGAGGSASLGSGPTGIALTGGYGCPAVITINSTSVSGGNGASTPFGGSGGGGGFTANGIAGVSNTGAGGGGGGTGNDSAVISGGGGGAGGFIDALITAPAASYSYAVGAAGSAGSAGTAGNAGGAGGSGIIIVDEFYN